MLTLSRLKNDLIEIPMSIAWYLTEISKSRGTQDLFIRQTPQKLERLREHALIESAVSSNRIEGVEIDRKRVGTVLFGKKLLTDRNEEEVQGYRKALDVIDAKHGALNVTERNIQLLHSLCRGEIWDAGRYKEKDGNIIERLPNGETTIRFKTVPAKKTPFFMKKLLEMNDSLMKNERIPSLITIAAFNLDFLCIHPFRDGNGRVSRLLLSLQLHRAGFEVGRYISLERLIEENKERYYETLKVSSQKWHDSNKGHNEGKIILPYSM